MWHHNTQCGGYHAHAFERKSCVLFKQQRRCIHRLRSLGIEQERSPKQLARRGGKKLHIFFTRPCDYCACAAAPALSGAPCHAMPRLMPSRAQASSVHDLACHGRPGRPGRAAFSASMAAAFGAPAPARQKASPPLLIFHPITHSAGGTRPNRAAPFTCPF